MLICLLQKRALLRDIGIDSVPNVVPLDPIFRAKSVLLLNAKDYLARRKWRTIWTTYKAHPEGQKVLARIKAIEAVYDEQRAQHQELLDIQTLFLQPLSLMADAGLVQRQDVNNAFHTAAITTLHQVLKALLDQERNNWPRGRYAHCIATKAGLMQEFYCAYSSDTNVMLHSLRRLLAKPEIFQFFSEIIAEHPSHFPDGSASAHSSNVEYKIQKLLERPLSHVARMLAAVRSGLPHIPPGHFLHADTIDAIQEMQHVSDTLVLLYFVTFCFSCCIYMTFCAGAYRDSAHQTRRNTGSDCIRFDRIHFLHPPVFLQHRHSNQEIGRCGISRRKIGATRSCFWILLKPTHDKTGFLWFSLEACDAVTV